MSRPRSSCCRTRQRPLRRISCRRAARPATGKAWRCPMPACSAAWCPIRRPATRRWPGTGWTSTPAVSTTLCCTCRAGRRSAAWPSMATASCCTARAAARNGAASTGRYGCPWPPAARRPRRCCCYASAAWTARARGYRPSGSAPPASCAGATSCAAGCNRTCRTWPAPCSWRSACSRWACGRCAARNPSTACSSRLRWCSTCVACITTPGRSSCCWTTNGSAG
ncbi:Uncharacterised protein [Bordetella pertussis]|nr:Uncharacterised protein [Bordetella pertussis]CFN59382.1 Uncharacterised protein [Bordetella pertussis]CFP64634.1 Uncharacterised protein [Bordetella pertussis]CPJ43924.1 Uncharacterised protein [Bordetella pertussis]CPJ56793.1 Uncharacterised protein [Bordetella pertussis]